MKKIKNLGDKDTTRCEHSVHSTPLHTPGPWEVKEVMGQKFVAATPYEGHPYFQRTRTIEVMSDDDYPTKDGDAYLISAAPDLLDVCKQFIIQCSLQDIKLGALIGDAEAAISKAERVLGSGSPRVADSTDTKEAEGQ